MASDDLRAARANSSTNLTSSEPDRVALPRPEEEGLDPFRRLEKRDWELWSIALILFTVFAGGIVTFAYISARGDPAASPGVLRWVWLLLFGLVALVLLLNVYLIDKKRTLSRLWRRTLAQEIELENQRLQAGTDSLTQVHNRRFFDEVGPKEVRRAVRANRPLSVLLVDIDHFREVNAQLGHFTGDEVLRLVADTLKNALRNTDYIFRFGGDEFLLLLPETNDAGAGVVMRRLRQALAARNDLHQRVGRQVTVTIAHATFVAGRSLESVVNEAESKLHSAQAEATQPQAKTPTT